MAQNGTPGSQNVLVSGAIEPDVTVLFDVKTCVGNNGGR